MRLPLLLLTCFVLISAEECPANAPLSQDLHKCFVTVPFPMNYVNAQRLCQRFGGRLAVINNPKDNKHVTSAVKKQVATYRKIWIGMIANEVADPTCAADSCPYSNWGTTQTCAVLEIPTGVWWIGDCKQEIPFVCEVPSRSQRSACPVCSITLNPQSSDLAFIPTTYPPPPTVPPPPPTQFMRTPPVSTGCPPAWRKHRSFCYNYYSIEKTWIDAERFCNSTGGHLASIHSEEEMSFVANGFRPESRFLRAWLGGKRRSATDSKYEWTDKTSFDYELWGDFEPNGECVHIDPDTNAWNKKWKTLPCEIKASFFCKKPSV